MSARDKCVGLTQIYVVLEIYYWITNLLHRCFWGLSKCKNRLSIDNLRVDSVILAIRTLMRNYEFHEFN